MLVIKAGGSVITRRGPYPAFDRPAAARLSRALARLGGPLALVHGTGSYGKPPAVRYGYLGGMIRPGSAPVPAIRSSLLELHSLFVSELSAAGVRAASCPGAACFAFRRGRPVLSPSAPARAWLRSGFAPVVNSDIFPDGKNFRVVSSDAMAAELAVRLHAGLAVFLTAAPGLLGPGGELLPELGAREFRKAAAPLRRPARDVSGGMAGKAEEISRLLEAGCDVAILDGRDPGALRGLRAGRRTGGTYIHAE